MEREAAQAVGRRHTCGSQAVAPLRIFRRQDIVAAMRDHLRRGTIDVPTCQNTRRGAAAAAAPGKDAPAADGLAGLSLNHNAR